MAFILDLTLLNKKDVDSPEKGAGGFAHLADLEYGDYFHTKAGDLTVFWSVLGVAAVGIKSPDGSPGDGVIYMLGNDFLCVRGRNTLSLEKSVPGTRTLALVIHLEKLERAIRNANLASFGPEELKKRLERINRKTILFHYPATRNLIPCFEILAADMTSLSRLRDLVMVDVARLLARIALISEKGFTPLESGAHIDDITYVLKYVRENYNRAVLKDLRRDMHYDPRYLSSMLKKSIGMSFRELTELRKTIVARDKLRNSDKSFERIGREMGFLSYSGFYKFCIKHLGMSPGRYREISRQKSPVIDINFDGI